MTKQISPFRQCMLDDMAFRNMSPATHKRYTYAVACFAQYHRTSPDKLGIEHVRQYRLHLLSRGLNPIVGALRMFYGTTLDTMRWPTRLATPAPRTRCQQC